MSERNPAGHIIGAARALHLGWHEAAILNLECAADLDAAAERALRRIAQGRIPEATETLRAAVEQIETRARAGLDGAPAGDGEAAATEGAAPRAAAPVARSGRP